MNRDRLLVIDDDDGFRSYVRRVSEASGFDTWLTNDPDAFKEKLRSWNPSAVMIDLNMPKSDGIELLRTLAAAQCKAKILIISGAHARILQAAKQIAEERGLSIVDTVQKPVRAAALREILNGMREVEAPLLASALAHAIAHGELVIDYQPKLDCRSRRIVGVEALVRWRHPTRGVIPPDKFIPLAEQSGLIRALTRRVAQTAIMQAQAWRRSGISLELALNISALDLEDLELPEMIVGLCEDSGFPADFVTLELTESAAMTDFTQMMDVLTRLRLKGVHLSIDDFGTGYSSLAKLQRLPFSEIKVDRSFVMQMDKSRDCSIIVEAIIGIGQKLGLATVAEGVETAECLTALIEMGVDFAQGYHIGRPMDGEKLARLLVADAAVK